MRKFLKRIGQLFLLYWGFNILIILYRAFSYSSFDCVEVSDYNPDTQNYLHTRGWKDYQGVIQNCMEFEGRFTDYDLSYNTREGLPYPHYEDPHYATYWGNVYQTLVTERSSTFDAVRDSLAAIILNQNLDAYEAANLLVTFVQDIEYTLIKTDDCTDDDNRRCLGNQKFGLLTPTEFLYELQGDCDTRAVFLFKLLADFGYDPIVVISREYLHAMIAINLPASGDYIEHQGIKYYFWETTAAGWQAGMLPPSYPTVDYWKVALSLQTNT